MELAVSNADANTSVTLPKTTHLSRTVVLAPPPTLCGLKTISFAL
jgi:hypothetical protein